MPAATLRDASRRFGGFYVPRFEIHASGSGVDPGVLRDVMQVTYNDSTTDIDSFDMTLNNWDAARRQFKYVGAEQNSVHGDTPTEQLFNPGAAEFELRFGYGSELTPVIRGTTTSLEPTFPSSGASTLTVRALNVLHRLRTRQHRAHWPNNRVPKGTVKISRIAEDIGNRVIDGERFPLPIRTDSQAKAREPVLEYVAQENQHDIDFLLFEARKIGYVVYVAVDDAGDEVLHFGPSDGRIPGEPEALYELEWGNALIDFTPKLSIANQVTAVEVRSWDRESNRSIRKRAEIGNVGVNSDLAELIEEREEIITNEPQHSEEQALRRATAVLSDRLKELVVANATTVGLPDLRSGERVLIKGVGKRFEGRYFVTRTTHTFDGSGYRTKFSARREAPR